MKYIIIIAAIYIVLLIFYLSLLIAAKRKPCGHQKVKFLGIQKMNEVSIKLYNYLKYGSTITKTKKGGNLKWQ